MKSARFDSNHCDCRICSLCAAPGPQPTWRRGVWRVLGDDSLHFLQSWQRVHVSTFLILKEQEGETDTFVPDV